jgi:hypothetical protein
MATLELCYHKIKNKKLKIKMANNKSKIFSEYPCQDIADA